jgi:hypothetical protein
MRIKNLFVAAAFVASAAMGRVAPAQTSPIQSVVPTGEGTDRQNATSAFDPDHQYRRFIDIENMGDLTSIRQLFWKSPSAVFIGKTPPEKVAKLGNWAAFWGEDAVTELQGIVQSKFHITPDYSRVKTVFLSRDVAETYAPVEITVTFAGLNPSPRPLLQIIDWIHTEDGWKIATIIAVPVPAATAK